MVVIDEAFTKLFPAPTQLRYKPWRKAVLILKNFSVPVLGERLALQVLCEVINYVQFPTKEMTVLICGQAANKIPEILGLNPDHELSADEVVFIQMHLEQGESIKEIEEHWRSQSIE